MLDKTIMVYQAEQFILDRINLIETPILKEIAVVPLNYPAYKTCRGAKEKHHGFKGGLIVHTAEVLENALLMAKSKSLKIDLDCLITAIIWHDFGKIWEYKYSDLSEAVVEYRDHKTLIVHLSRSFAEFIFVANSKQLCDYSKEKIGHIILAHHGRQDWGSPIEPILSEAYVIHYADMLSAKCALNEYER